MKFFSLFFIADEFRSKTACENEVIQLVCNPFSRIAIYSASYGRTEYESIQCTQPQGVKEESKFGLFYLNYRLKIMIFRLRAEKTPFSVWKLFGKMENIRWKWTANNR